MTMNYGGSRAAGDPWETPRLLDERRLAAARRCVPRRRLPLNEDLWKMMGATPMIGQNDVAQDVFTQSDATAVLSFAERVGPGPAFVLVGEP